MPVSTWPGIRQLREALGRRDPAPSPNVELPRLTLTLDFAALGSAERVHQMRRMVNEFQQLLQEASAAHS